MPRRDRTVLEALRREERGFAMVAVLLMSVILFIVAATITARSLSDYDQVRSERLFQRALQVADAGVDGTLFKLGPNPAYTTGEILPASFSPQTEEEWVLTNVADNPVATVPDGQWAVVKPGNFAVVFSVGYVPTKAAPVKTRIVRAEYDFAPFVPTVAILTDGDLKVSGNPTVDGSAGSAHANGDVLLNGNPVFSGYVSASGSYSTTGNPQVGDPENTGGEKPPREVPLVDPRENYLRSEYDLCPGGEVRTGPAFAGPQPPNLTDVPCQGTHLFTATNIEYRGWKQSGTSLIDGDKWDYVNTQAYDGVYYIYQGTAKVTSAPGSSLDPWEVTILAEAQASGSEPGHCPHIGGDIDVSGNPSMRSHDKASPLLLIAGRDLEVSGNPGAGQVNYDGVLAAHEQFSLSGNPKINGVLVANDYCNTPGSPVDETTISGNPQITYDGNAEIPLGRTIRTTHWLEI